MAKLNLGKIAESLVFFIKALELRPNYERAQYNIIRVLTYHKPKNHNSNILLTWSLPKNNLSQIAPNLNWIHCIGDGFEHLYPFDWLPNKVILTSNKGVHRKKAGEFGLMAILMLHNHFPKVINNQFNKEICTFRTMAI